MANTVCLCKTWYDNLVGLVGTRGGREPLGRFGYWFPEVGMLTDMVISAGGFFAHHVRARWLEAGVTRHQCGVVSVCWRVTAIYYQGSCGLRPLCGHPVFDDGVANEP